jgi:MFS family permease
VTWSSTHRGRLLRARSEGSGSGERGERREGSARSWGAALAAALPFVTSAAGVTSTSSLFVAYRSQRGFTAADIAIVFSSYVATLLPLLIVMSGVKRVSRRALATCGLVLGTAGLVAIAMAPGLPVMIVGRLLQGLAVGLSIGALTAAFTESYPGSLPPGTAVQVMATVGLGLGPLISAVAYNLGGGLTWSYAPSVVMMVACFALLPRMREAGSVGAESIGHATVVGEAASLGAAAAAADGNEVADAEMSGSVEPWRVSGGASVLPPPVVWRALAFAMPVLFTSWASLSIYLSLMPSYLAEALRAENPLIGAGAILAAQVASLSATLAFRRVAPEKSGVVAPVVMIVGLVILVVGTTWNVWPLIGLSTVLVGGGAGVAAAASFGVAERVAAGQRDRVFARMFVASYLGYSLPAIAIGAVAARWSLTAGIASVIVVLSGITTGTVAIRGRALEVDA